MALHAVAELAAAAQVFSMRQRGQLDVYGLWGVLRGQLLTDDSFEFNRVLSRIKDSIQHLPEATAEDDDALLRLKVAFALPFVPFAQPSSYGSVAVSRLLSAGGWWRTAEGRDGR